MEERNERNEKQFQVKLNCVVLRSSLRRHSKGRDHLLVPRRKTMRRADTHHIPHCNENISCHCVSLFLRMGCRIFTIRFSNNLFAIIMIIIINLRCLWDCELFYHRLCARRPSSCPLSVCRVFAQFASHAKSDDKTTHTRSLDSLRSVRLKFCQSCAPVFSLRLSHFHRASSLVDKNGNNKANGIFRAQCVFLLWNCMRECVCARFALLAHRSWSSAHALFLRFVFVFKTFR